MGRLLNLLKQFRGDERGVFGIIFALLAVVLIALSGAVVDFVSVEQARNRAQVALDAATLALQKDIFLTPLNAAAIQSKAQALVTTQIGDARITATLNAPVINLTTGSLYLSAHLTVPTMFVTLVGVNQMEANVASEATRGSMNIEVAVAVDITGSMAQMIPVSDGSAQQSKVAALKIALGELIDIVVKDAQTPTYSKMAIVPYSMAVNVGSTYAPSIRGAVTAPTAITNVTWAASTAKTITGATTANPVVITANSHGFIDGDRVFINSATGMAQLNNQIYTVAGATTNKFQLQGINGTSYGSYSGNAGRVTKCLVAACELVVTSAGHGLAAGANAYISGVVGTNSSSMKTYSAPSWPSDYIRFDNNPAFDNASYNWVNNNTNGEGDYRFLVWKIGAVAPNTFVLPGTSRATKDFGTYSSGGTVACVTAGCEYYLYQNHNSNSSSWRRQQISTCVTERTTNAFTDASAATTPLGRNYPTAPNPCLTNTVVPLTSVKTTLHATAEALVAGGSTAGHTGVAWAWYMVSPNFNGPWPPASQPAAAATPNVLKAVVLMTDGEFNSSYCNGVISQSSTSGSGDTNNQINCDAPNGSSYHQTEELCKAMKAKNIRVYTVGFDVVDSQSARDLMANCATEPSMAYEATTGEGLSDVFADIGKNLAYLRITQ
ncbi:MAG: hypothetical protein JWR51_1011 [Devosia sp.]|nr:hypothetical protein [Devosia sp.]